MTQPPLIEQIAERVERLLVRHEELRRTNELLTQQLHALTHERDSLKSRLMAARARVDSLIDRLPGAATVLSPEPAAPTAADQERASS
ncbi:DUF904 domain-containing protein [Ottowia sp.]|uniref:DUF904 domain-containing protein n=1 Tax=Ottowia sp. TaxID=1898956 RepID=UPI002BA644C7|nr:DUF904 domain-containing protein [Ottowia sp.]HOB67244.1 DUF904 domain-containing protein [Ottowia sp.]HPZ56532.1 DUF904 domain-containing protein [Ottowia sp.]HQD47664.1 DUF904 domain-containing protein [Ottowia sp.]